MCGRSACTLDPQTIKDNLHTQRWDNQVRSISQKLQCGTNKPVVLNENGRVLKSMKWGYMGNNPQLSTINARSEGITSSPMWSKLVPTNRCAIVANGYYEWQTIGGENGKKQPHFIHLKDKPLIVMAGLYEEQLEENESEPVYHYTIITTQNSKDLGWLHDRMPVILDSDEKIDLWLSHEFFTLKSQILSLLRPMEGLECYAVPELVNSNRNDSPDCLRHLEDFKKTGGIAAFFQAPKKEVKSEPVEFKKETKKKEVAKKPAGIAAFFAPKKEEVKSEKEEIVDNSEKIKEEEKEEGAKKEELQALKEEIKSEVKEEIIAEIKEVKDEIKKELEHKEKEKEEEEEEEEENDESETAIKEEESDKEEEAKRHSRGDTKTTRKRKLDSEDEEELPKEKKGKSKK